MRHLLGTITAPSGATLAALAIAALGSCGTDTNPGSPSNGAAGGERAEGGVAAGGSLTGPKTPTGGTTGQASGGSSMCPGQLGCDAATGVGGDSTADAATPFTDAAQDHSAGGASPDSGRDGSADETGRLASNPGYVQCGPDHECGGVSAGGNPEDRCCHMASESCGYATCGVGFPGYACDEHVDCAAGESCILRAGPGAFYDPPYSFCAVYGPDNPGALFECHDSRACPSGQMCCLRIFSAFEIVNSITCVPPELCVTETDVVGEICWSDAECPDGTVCAPALYATGYSWCQPPQAPDAVGP
jgi:hypothetical protein